MSEPMTLFGGPLDGLVINYKGGWKVRVLSSIDYENYPWRYFFADYIVLGPGLKVLAWDGVGND